MMVFSYKTVRNKNYVTNVFILYKLITSGMIFLRLMSLKISSIFATTKLILNWFYLPDTSFLKSYIPTKHMEGRGQQLWGHHLSHDLWS